MTDAPDPILAALQQDKVVYQPLDDIEINALTCRFPLGHFRDRVISALKAQSKLEAADATLARVQAALTHCRKRINAWVDDDRQGSSEAVTLLCDIAEWIDAALAPQTPTPTNETKP